MADANLGVENPGGQPSGADGNTGNPQQNAPGGGQQPVAGGGQGNGEKVYTYKEDRTDWVPRHRLNEYGQRLTKAEQDAQRYQSELEAERRRVQALAGVTPQDPKQQEAEEVKAALYQMFPQLKALEKMDPEAFDRVMRAAQTAESTTQAHWERHATSMLTDLRSNIAQQLGAESLTPTQQRQVDRAYREEAQAAMHARQVAVQRGERPSVQTMPGDSDFLARHERGDKALLTEFAKAFLDDWMGPARRVATADAARRGSRPVPRGDRARVPVTQGTPNIDFTNEDQFKQALIAARGGSRE